MSSLSVKLFLLPKHFFSLFMINLWVFWNTFIISLYKLFHQQGEISLSLCSWLIAGMLWQLFQIENPHVPNLSNMGRPIARSHIRQFILGRRGGRLWGGWVVDWGFDVDLLQCVPIYGDEEGSKKNGTPSSLSFGSTVKNMIGVDPLPLSGPSAKFILFRPFPLHKISDNKAHLELTVRFYDWLTENSANYAVRVFHVTASYMMGGNMRCGWGRVR